MSLIVKNRRSTATAIIPTHNSSFVDDEELAGLQEQLKVVFYVARVIQWRMLTYRYFEG